MTVLARRLMQSASSAVPRFSLPQVFLAQLHLLLGEMEDAIVVLNQLMRLNYMPEQTSFCLAKLYCSVGRIDQAEIMAKPTRFACLHERLVSSRPFKNHSICWL